MFINNLLKYAFAVAALLTSWQASAGLNIQHWETNTGADVYYVENHELPIIDLSMSFAAGSARDEPAKAGLASMTRNMMTLGAGGLSDEDISKHLADVGAQLGGDFDADKANFKLRSLSSEHEFNQALDIFTQILQKPDFPESVLAREKSRVIASLKEAATQPDSIANKAFMKALYGSHPYSYDSITEPETVDAITSADLQSYYVNHYSAKGAVIALIGDLTREQAVQLTEKLTAGLPIPSANAAIPSVSYPQQSQEQQIPHPAKQSHILLGYPGVKRGDPDYFPLYVGNYILGGGGFVSRLTEEVREKRGLVYSVYSYFLPMEELGPFQIGLQTKREQSEDALKLVRETLNTFIEKGVTESELNAAKQNITGGFPLRLDSNAKILDYLTVIGFYKLPLSFLDDFNANVNKVTTAQIKDAFNRRIDPSKMVTIIVAGNPLTTAPEGK
jgi:zinc protease